MRFVVGLSVSPLALGLGLLPACVDTEAESSPIAAAEADATQALESAVASPEVEIAACVEPPCGRISLPPGANRAAVLRVDGVHGGRSRVEFSLIAPTGTGRVERVADLTLLTDLAVPWNEIGELPDGRNAQLEVTVRDARGVITAGPTVFYVMRTAAGLVLEEEQQPPSFVRDVVVIGGASPQLEGSEGVDP
ncbi:MAG: hypothetical protein IT382_18750 [Deltaproteobacteria bacterium]|nr:hypothetical protein [Deltaproteobacteria bacterium]